MKVNSMLLAAAFLTVFSACDRESPGMPGDSIITGLQNGKKWVAPARGSYQSNSDTVTMLGSKISENDILGENVAFTDIPFQTGKFHLNKATPGGDKPSSVLYSVIGLDALNSRFDLDEASENFIKVEIANLQKKYISGTFQAVYVRDSSDTKYTRYLPDTLRFTDGFFRINKIRAPR